MEEINFGSQSPAGFEPTTSKGLPEHIINHLSIISIYIHIHFNLLELLRGNFELKIQKLKVKRCVFPVPHSQA